MADQVDALGLPVWPAAERNKGPILEQLERVLAGHAGLFLELGAGTGQHAVHFAHRLTAFQVQPTDWDPEHITTLAARVRRARLENLLAPMRIDISESRWPIESADVLYCANVLHVAPWSAAEALMAGAGRLLPPCAPLITYGPYKRHGRHTAESNEHFDESLRARDPAFGVRDVTELAALAGRHGLELFEQVGMPANNLLLVWRKR
jgi:SAM-dependent methyltransferase